MYTIIGTLTARPETREELASLLMALVAPTRAEAAAPAVGDWPATPGQAALWLAQQDHRFGALRIDVIAVRLGGVQRLEISHLKGVG